MLDLPKREPRASDMSMLIGYWRGIGPVERMTIAARETRGFNRIPCEDDIDLLVAARAARTSPAATPRPASGATTRRSATSPRSSTPASSTAPR